MPPTTTSPDPRTEFGAARTVCGCAACVKNCRFLPGFLIPADLPRLMPLGCDRVAWARDNLRASPGARVGRRRPDGTLETFRVPTLVPAHRADLSCRWLEEGRCAVHAAAPFGCAFFDCGTPAAAGDALSARGLAEILDDRAEGGPYARLWDTLHAEGLVAPPPEAKRAAMAAAAGPPP